MTPKLLRCPKCGGKAKVIRVESLNTTDKNTDHRFGYRPYCTECKCTLNELEIFPNRDMAVRKWNKAVKESSKSKRIVNVYDIRGYNGI